MLSAYCAEIAAIIFMSRDKEQDAIVMEDRFVPENVFDELVCKEQSLDCSNKPVLEAPIVFENYNMCG